MSFFNVMMLAGLAAVAIPPIIHLLNRRRYEVVDWGAMQFLQVSEVTRRRLLIEEILLMLLRMGLIAVLVLAIAGPFTDDAGRLAALAGGPSRPNRDVVLVFDGSASMSFKGTGPSAHEQAKDWATTFVNGLAPGDGVALLVARTQPVALLGNLTTDLDRARDHIQKLPAPSGTCDWPLALQAAHAILDKSQRGDRDVLLIGDGQRFTWSDRRTLLGWEDLAGKRGGDDRPGLWVVNLDPGRPKDAANWSLGPVAASRAVVATNQEVTFRTSLRLDGQAKYEPPHEVRLEVDGQFVTRLDVPAKAELDRGQVPFSFAHRFATPGSHLVTVVVEPDPPEGKRKPGYAVKDHLPVDNRRDFAVEVLDALPVLLVDGDDADDPPRRGSDFLRDALAPARDRAPAVRVKVVTAKEFSATLLRGEPREAGDDKGKDDRPRVLIFCNVARLSDAQQEAVEAFLREGGGVLVALGDRADRPAYNALHRGGEGWLPARLEQPAGDEGDVGKAARPLPSTFYHPALELFRKPTIGGLDSAWFARWWKLTAPGPDAEGGAVARLNKEEAPFLAEKRHGEGRVLLCCVPLDTSWRTNVTELPAFVPLAHELVYYLASARAADYNLEPGQPLRYRLPREASLEGLRLVSPSERGKGPAPTVEGREAARGRPLLFDTDGDSAGYPARVVDQAQGRLLVHEGMREAGVWELLTATGQTVYYAVQSDPREADLTPFGDEDKKKVGAFVPFAYEDDALLVLEGLSKDALRLEFWDWFLLGVLALLCAEVWFTRRIVRNRA